MDTTLNELDLNNKFHGHYIERIEPVREEFHAHTKGKHWELNGQSINVAVQELNDRTFTAAAQAFRSVGFGKFLNPTDRNLVLPKKFQIPISHLQNYLMTNSPKKFQSNTYKII